MGTASAKVVLVTGASSGIGEATAIRLSQAGFTVYAAARRVERMAGLSGRGIHVLPLDLIDETSIVAAVERIIREQGRVDVLVNNAGYGSFGALEDISLTEARRQFEVNVFAAARLMQLVLPGMREQRHGKIINVTSVGGKIYQPMGSWYHATKHALEAMSDCLRLEVQSFGIDVIIVEPGCIKSELVGMSVENMLRVSGDTAYRELARLDAGLLAAGDQRADPPDLIAMVIERAIQARRPRTRYAAGVGAGLMLPLRRVLPDRAFDWLMLRIMRTMQ